MEFVGFEDTDFSVFEVPGLDERMVALKHQFRPKLEQLGHDLTPLLTDILGVPMFAHVAKHARRRVNPPNDSWVSICADKRGYKKHPHFEIGAWRTHIFALFGLLYESPTRTLFAERFRMNAADVVASLPQNYVWVADHTNPVGISGRDITVERALELASRMATARAGELFIGMQFQRSDVVLMSPVEFENAMLDYFEKMEPLFRMATAEVVVR